METKDITVTCHTDGCENKDIAISITIPNEENHRVICGPCGNDITDKHD
jgi:hypothetical protein